MKISLRLFLIFYLIQLSSYAQKIITIADSYMPMRLLNIAPNKYLLQTEIANIHYLEFLHYSNVDSSAEFYKKMVIKEKNLDWPITSDNHILHQEENFNSRSVNVILSGIYFRFPSFRPYPVVGISYEQAKSYCNWLAQVNNITLNNDVKLRCRLPKTHELELARNEIPTKKFLNKKIRRRLKKEGHNLQKDLSVYPMFIKQDISDILPEHLLISQVNFLGPVDSGIENEKGFYNLYGNVAEMTNSEGISTGGSWVHTVEEITTRIKYYEPNSWTGFRCLCLTK